MPASELKKFGLGLAGKLLTRLSEILATEFPTNTPEVLGRIIQRIVKFITSALDSNDDEGVNLADPIYFLNMLFNEGPVPPAPFPGCGNDPTGGLLPCESFPICP